MQTMCNKCVIQINGLKTAELKIVTYMHTIQSRRTFQWLRSWKLDYLENQLCVISA